MRGLRVGFLLGFRQIQRANLWTNILIVFVMMLTFLNIVAVSGILVGLIEGAVRGVQEESLGDVVLSPLQEEDFVLETPEVLRRLSTFGEITAYTVRYQETATIEANFKERRDLSAERDIVVGNVTGIDVEAEDRATNLSSSVTEGEYLDPNEQGYILIGKFYIDRYAEQFGDVFDSLEDVFPGDTVRLSVNGVSKEFIVKGIVDSKVDEVSLNAYIPEKEFRRVFGRINRDAEQIIIRIDDTTNPIVLQNAIRESGIGAFAKVETFEEAQPKFITDIKDTFDLLGTFIGSIGLVVASITIFIVIFINALSRRVQIGILKAIGIERHTIQTAYVTQAAFYAITGSIIGIFLTFVVLVPYFDANPINFPFSDGILLVEPLSALTRSFVLFVITLFAGFLPAWLIVRQNTLDSILGR